ncbi:unnamed protein product, partial [Trichogramma brassicae]
MFLCTCLFKPLATIDDESDAKFDIVLRDLGKSKSSRDNGDRETEEGEKSKSSRENNNCKIEEEEESAKSSRENNNCKTEEEVSAKSSRENEDCKIEEEEQKSIDFSLHSAIKRGLMHEMEILLRVGVDPNSANDQKSTPLHLICTDDVSLIKHFLDTCKNIKTPVQVNAQDCKGKTPLHLALVGVKNASSYWLQDILLEMYPEPQDASDRTFPRLTVADEPNRAVELLLRSDANPNVADNEGSTSLHVICKRDDDNDNLMEMLFEICDEVDMPVEVDARDKTRCLVPSCECGSRFCRRWQVPSLLCRLHLVSVVLASGATLRVSIGSFPTAARSENTFFVHKCEMLSRTIFPKLGIGCVSWSRRATSCNASA